MVKNTNDGRMIDEGRGILIYERHFKVGPAWPEDRYELSMEICKGGFVNILPEMLKPFHKKYVRFTIEELPEPAKEIVQ